MMRHYMRGVSAQAGPEAEEVAHVRDRQKKIPDDGLFKVKTVLEIIDVGQTTWFDWVRSGFAPKPIKLGFNTFWRGRDIWAFVDAAEHAMHPESARGTASTGKGRGGLHVPVY